MSRNRTKLYQELARLIGAQDNCRKSGNKEWEDKHGESIGALVDFLPSGSGIDSGISLDPDSTPEKLIFHFGYHHMNEAGMYDGWTQHTLTVKPSLQFDIDMRISGPNRNDIKEYLHEVFHHALTSEVWQDVSEPYPWKCSLYENCQTSDE